MNYDERKRKVEAKLQEWKAKLLSQVGRVTLTKSVVLAIPLYAMTAYKLPDAWCQAFESMANKFIWSGSKEGRGFHSVSWT